MGTSPLSVHSVKLRISPSSVRMRENMDQKKLYLDTFHAVVVSPNSRKNFIPTDLQFFILHFENNLRNDFHGKFNS